MNFNTIIIIGCYKMHVWNFSSTKKSIYICKRGVKMHKKNIENHWSSHIERTYIDGATYF